MPLREIVIGRDEEDRKEFGKKGTIFLGRHLVGEGDDANLTNPVHMDVARPHVMVICGKRGQGKSYTSAVITEEMCRLPKKVRNNLSFLLIDPMGIYWSLKNSNEKQYQLLNQWDLEGQSFDVDVYIPQGFQKEYRSDDIPFDETYSITASSLTSEDWALAFGIDLIKPLGILMSRILNDLEEYNYTVEDIISKIGQDERADKNTKEALENLFITADGWGIFSQQGTDVREILSPGKVTVLDVSRFGQVSRGWSVRTLLVALLSRKIYQARVAARRVEEKSKIEGSKIEEVPMTWIIMDEAHNFAPADGKVASTDPLIRIVKEGRQPGISTVFITQRPNKLHEDVIAQADLLLSHRLTAKPDLEALRNIMQTYMNFDIQKYINDLPRKKGSAIVLDDNSERIYSMRVRPRMSWHAGGTPIALEQKSDFEV
ncbi:MAG: ATP-binding protein [Candidatus Aenigmatarchaeota archaeon]